MGAQTGITILFFVGGLFLAREMGSEIVANNVGLLEMASLAAVFCAIAVAILRNWRFGFYLFNVWLLFEDLFRKYMGNGLALFFGKDILAIIIYVSLFAANSPHILYGLPGFKLDFFYIPMIFVGYAFVRNREDLRNLLVLNAVLAIVISGVEIIQAIVGNSFLNPATLAPELRGLGNLEKITPISGQIFSLPPSVFVSTGRFGRYLALWRLL